MHANNCTALSANLEAQCNTYYLLAYSSCLRIKHKMDSGVKYQKFVVSQDPQDAGSDKPSGRSDSSIRCLIIGLLLVVALMASLAAVAIGVGVGVSVSRSQPAPTASGLTTITVTPEELEGQYYGDNGGIHFRVTSNSSYAVVTITSASGEPVVFVIHPMVSNMTVMSVNNTNFMVMENQPERPKYDDYVLAKDGMNMMESIMMGEREMSDDVYRYLDNTTVNETRQSVLHRLAMSQEALLIIEAAQALGDLGIQGIDYPAVMRFYLLALRLASSREDTTVTRDTKELGGRQRRAVTCSSNGATCSSGRCPYSKGSNKCFGLCGKGCSCWSFICGN